jgi:hypothetical protein
MTANGEILSALRDVLSQDASIPALRALLFLLGVFAALAWARRRPLLALLFLSMGGTLGLGYWLVQVVSPLGYGTDPALTRVWAQAGVNAMAEPKGSGFVWGTEPGFSLVPALASVGIPIRLVFLAPQLAAGLALCLLALAPFGFLRNRTSAAFAGSLALGGGLWPGVAPYGSILLRPAALVGSLALLGLLLPLAQVGRVRRAFHRSRLGLAVTLIAAATLDRALGGGEESGVSAALLLSGATFVLALPLRAALRNTLSTAAMARRAEALLLLCAFGGSGLLWWDPPRTTAGFDEARDRNEGLARPLDWIRRNVPPTSVVLASPEYGAAVAMYGGRRVLFSTSHEPEDQTLLPQPFRRTRLVESARLGRPIARLAEAFSVTHFFLGPGEASPPLGVDAPSTDEERLELVLVYEDVQDFRIFRLAKK